MKYEKKINLLLTIPLSGVLLIMMVVALPVLITNVLDWNEKIQDHMVEVERTNLETRAEVLGKLTSATFKRFGRDISLAAYYGSIIETLPVRNSYQKFYGATPEIPSERNSAYIDSDYSVWFNKFDSDPNQFPLNETSSMDNVFRPIFRASNRYAGIYYGGQTGLFYNHPWGDLSHYPTLSYICLTNNNPTIGYDPTCRNWYINGQTRPNTVQFTEPYTDASSGDVLISASKSIDSNSGSALNQNRGVIGSDISMQNLEEEILRQSVLDNGYSALVDSAGNAVIYPEMDREEIYSLVQMEFEDTDSDEAREFGDLFDSIVSSENTTGQLEYNKTSTLNGENATESEQSNEETRTWILTYSKVSDTNYIVLMMVPESDVTKPTDQIQSQSVTGIVVGSVLLVLLMALMIGLSIFVNRKIAQKVTFPIRQATSYFNDIGQGKLDVEMGNVEAEAPEYQELFILLGNLMKAVRFGNVAYLQEDPERAYENYEEVEKMLRKIKNKVGLGVVYNNKALALQDMKRFDEANESFKLAISNAEELADEADVENKREAKSYHRIKLGQRYMNYGRFFADKKDYKKAAKYFEMSIQIHDEEDDILGRIKSLGHLGLLYLDQKNRKYDVDKAFEYISQSYRLACDRHKKKPTKKNIIALQYGSQYMALFHMHVKAYPAAMQFFNFVLSLGETIDVKLKNVCLNGLLELHKLFGYNDGVKALEKELGSGGSKHITFVLDCSSSMSGNRIETCRKSISSILERDMVEDDTASLYTFDTRVCEVFKNQKIGRHLKGMLHDVQHRTVPNGSTAFYDAVYSAVDTTYSKRSNRTKWIVALTDGADNSSRKSVRDVANYVQEKKANIIIITVKLNSNASETIESIARGAKNAKATGMVLNANNTNEISKAFGKAIKEINSKGFANLEQL